MTEALSPSAHAFYSAALLYKPPRISVCEWVQESPLTIPKGASEILGAHSPPLSLLSPPSVSFSAPSIRPLISSPYA